MWFYNIVTPSAVLGAVRTEPIATFEERSELGQTILLPLPETPTTARESKSQSAKALKISF